MLYLIPFGSCGLYIDGGCFSPQDAILFSGYWNETFHTQLQFCFHLESSHTLNYAHLAKAESLQTRTLGLEFMWSVYVGFFCFGGGFICFSSFFVVVVNLFLFGLLLFCCFVLFFLFREEEWIKEWSCFFLSFLKGC